MFGVKFIDEKREQFDTIQVLSYLSYFLFKKKKIKDPDEKFELI